MRQIHNQIMEWEQEFKSFSLEPGNDLSAAEERKLKNLEDEEDKEMQQQQRMMRDSNELPVLGGKSTSRSPVAMNHEEEEKMSFLPMQAEKRELHQATTSVGAERGLEILTAAREDESRRFGKHSNSIVPVTDQSVLQMDESKVLEGEPSSNKESGGALEEEEEPSIPNLDQLHQLGNHTTVAVKREQRLNERKEDDSGINGMDLEILDLSNEIGGERSFEVAFNS